MFSSSRIAKQATTSKPNSISIYSCVRWLIHPVLVETGQMTNNMIRQSQGLPIQHLYHQLILQNHLLTKKAPAPRGTLLESVLQTTRQEPQKI